MKFIEKLNDQEINKILKPLNFYCFKNIKVIENKPNDEKMIILFCEKINKTKSDEKIENIFENVLGMNFGKYSISNLALCLKNYELFDSYHEKDYSKVLLSYVMKNPDYDEKFKQEYKKNFCKFHQQQIEK